MFQVQYWTFNKRDDLHKFVSTYIKEVGENEGAPPFGEHRPSQYRKKHLAYGNHRTLPGSTISSESNWGSELELALLIPTFKNYSIFILRCITVRLWHIWELQRMWMELKNTKKSRLLRPSYIEETCSIFAPAAFHINLRCL